MSEAIELDGGRQPAPRLSRDERREQILDSALRLINESGYDNVSIASIARAAGVTRPVIYSSFESLDELMYALWDRQARRVFTQVAQNLSGAGTDVDPRVLWTRNLASFLKGVSEDPETWRMMLLPHPSMPAELRSRLDEANKQIAVALQGLIKWGLEAQGMHDADVEMFTLIAIDLFENSARLMLSDPERYPPERMVRFTRSFFAFTSPARPYPAGE